jgi:NAD(P)-dependent dehydrogenase (short-subunit alcohol dehydrogenase family)
MKPLSDQVAVVAGGTRGAGRGIAVELGAAGATVVVTGRSTRAAPTSTERPETIEETAELVDEAGGVGVARRTDHLDRGQVSELARYLTEEHGGRLDILVNDIWGGDNLTSWGKPFWRSDLADGLRMQELAVVTHLITSHALVPLMVKRRSGLVVEVTDGDTLDYRGNLYYDLAKTSVMRLAYGQAKELEHHGVTALAVTPGFMRSEAVLAHFKVTEQNWQDGVATDPNFAVSETPRFVGRAVAALAADPDVGRRAGRTLTSWDLAEEYGFDDVDGRRPHWGRHFATLTSP